jgi:hypothetical protein
MKKLETLAGLNKSNFKNWIKINGSKSVKYLAGLNRSIIPSQVTKLATSVDKMGVIRPVVLTEISFIDGKKAWYIIDGQHLFNACLRNGIDIPYVMVEIKDKQDLVEKIALLNASSKSWSLQDYITAWSSLKDDYIKLNHYFQIYDFELSMIASLLSGRNVLSSRSGGGFSVITRKIKSGEFEIVNEEECIKLLNCLTDALRIVRRQSREENSYFCSEYVNFYKSSTNYNHDKFITKLKSKKDLFVTTLHEEGKLVELFNTL